MFFSLYVRVFWLPSLYREKRKKKYVLLKVFSKLFALIYSYLSRVLNILETSISLNTFQLGVSNHSN